MFFCIFVTASCCSVFNVTVTKALFPLCLLYCESDVQNFGQNISEYFYCQACILYNRINLLFNVSVSSVGEVTLRK